MQTDPPPRGRLSETVNQWIIFDSYTAYEIAKNKEEERDQQKEQKDVKAEKISFLSKNKESSPGCVNNKMLKAVKILERMVNQNEYDDIAQGGVGYNHNEEDGSSNVGLDFRFYEDASDEFKEGEGTLLPLWKFVFEEAKSLEVTSLCWNPQYNDLFAVGFGSCKSAMMIPSKFVLFCFRQFLPPRPAGGCLHILPEEPVLP